MQLLVCVRCSLLALGCSAATSPDLPMPCAKRKWRLATRSLATLASRSPTPTLFRKLLLSMLATSYTMPTESEELPSVWCKQKLRLQIDYAATPNAEVSNVPAGRARWLHRPSPALAAFAVTAVSSPNLPLLLKPAPLAECMCWKPALWPDCS